MSNFPELFKELKLNNYYKYLLYLCGIILILSFLIDFKNVDVGYVRHISFWVIIISLLTWILDATYQNINCFVYEGYIKKAVNGITNSMEKYYNFAKILTSIWWVIQLILWSITFYLLFIIKK